MMVLMFMVPFVSAGYMTTYNPFTSRLDYVRSGNWSDYNGTLEFPSIDVAGGYSGGGVTIEDDGDFWTKGDIYIDNGTVFLVANPVINGTFLPAVDSMFNLGSQTYRWAQTHTDLLNSREVYTGVGYGSSNFLKIGAPDIETNGYGDELTINVNDDGTGTLYLGNAEGDIVEIQENDSLILSNDNWLRAYNNASDSYVNMIKVNENDELVLGANLLSSGTEFAEDSGSIMAFDMPVSSSATAGTEMSYAFKLDGTEVFKAYSQADGSGSITNESLRVSTNNGIIVGAGSSGDADVTVLSVLESEGVTGQIKWDDGTTAWNFDEPLGSFRFTGNAVSMTGIYSSANGNGRVDTTGTGTIGLELSSQDAASPDIMIDPNRGGVGILYLGNDEADNVTIRDGDRFISEGFALGSDECYLYDGEGNCRLAGNTTCTWMRSPDGTNTGTPVCN